MPSLRDAAELPVLVMYNLDTEWKQADKMNQKAEIELMSSSLEGLGHPVSRLEINGNSLHRTLSGYEPSDWIVMNLCEEIPGVPHSEATVAHLLESRNMIYTGSPPEIIGNCENKQFVKHTLSALGLPTPLWASTAAWASAPNRSFSTAGSWSVR